MYGGVGCVIGGGFSPALPPNKRINPTCLRCDFWSYLAGEHTFKQPRLASTGKRVMRQALARLSLRMEVTIDKRKNRFLSISIWSAPNITIAELLMIEEETYYACALDWKT